MLSIALLWTLGLLLVTGTLATVGVVYAALRIAARTDAIIGECKWDPEEMGSSLCASSHQKPRKQWRLPHLPRRAAV